MDAAGSERAAVLSISEGRPMCALFAAMTASGRRRLVLMGTFARSRWAPDYPHGISDELSRERLRRHEEDWPEGVAREWLTHGAGAG